MVLHVSDFGCVPDGRFLDRAFIAAGSAVVTDGDSSLRVTDVGTKSRSPVLWISSQRSRGSQTSGR